MEQNNDIDNPKTNIPETAQEQTGMPQQTAVQTPEQPLTESVPPQKTGKKWLVPVLIGLLVIALAVAGFFAYQNFQLKKAQTASTQTIPTPASSSPTPTTLPPNQPPQSNTSQFNYENFTMSYPADWTLSNIDTATDFPLKDRLSGLYASGKVVALSKEGTHLIITIEEESDGGAGGIFLSDSDLDEYISTRDKVMIGSATLYVNKSHSDIPSLTESHGGPYMWGAVSEFIPNKITNDTGETVDGHEDVIKKNGYAYNFIVTSNKGGETDPELHQEILRMLEAIEW